MSTAISPIPYEVWHTCHICYFHQSYDVRYKHGYGCTSKACSKLYITLLNCLCIAATSLLYWDADWISTRASWVYKSKSECCYSKSDEYRAGSRQIKLGKTDGGIVPTRQQLGNHGSRLEWSDMEGGEEWWFQWIPKDMIWMYVQFL